MRKGTVLAGKRKGTGTGTEIGRQRVLLLMVVASAVQMTAVITPAGTVTTEGLAGRVAGIGNTGIGLGKTIIGKTITDHNALAAHRSAASAYGQQYVYRLYQHLPAFALTTLTKAVGNLIAPMT